MHWIIQKNLYNEKGLEDLAFSLARLNIPHSFHKIIPFIGELLPDIDVFGPVIVIGSYSLNNTVKKKGWKPGFIDIIHQDFEKQREHWGENMLNYDAHVYCFGDTFNLEEEFFIRPSTDSKCFSGTLMTRKEFLDWRYCVLDLKEDDGSTITKDTKIVISSPKKILQEYRFWIINGNIITSSLYKMGHRVVYSSNVDKAVEWFVMSMTHPMSVHSWNPAHAYVLDIAMVGENKFKIIEINNINSAGLYAANIPKLVMALEDLYNK
jgi:hypothetical protein